MISVPFCVWWVSQKSSHRAGPDVDSAKMWVGRKGDRTLVTEAAKRIGEQSRGCLVRHFQKIVGLGLCAWLEAELILLQPLWVEMENLFCLINREGTCLWGILVCKKCEEIGSKEHKLCYNTMEKAQHGRDIHLPLLSCIIMPY